MKRCPAVVVGSVVVARLPDLPAYPNEVAPFPAVPESIQAQVASGAAVPDELHAYWPMYGAQAGAVRGRGEF